MTNIQEQDRPPAGSIRDWVGCEKGAWTGRKRGCEEGGCEGNCEGDRKTLRCES